MKKTYGVFCLEGDWWNDLRKPSTVEPILELLSKADNVRVPYIHLNVGNRESFNDYLAKWTQRRFRNYPVLYLAFHGNQGEIVIGDKRFAHNTISLSEIGDLLQDKCRGRIILLGSCDTVNVHGRILNTLLKKTGALAVCGYCTNVDWIIATAFELIALASMQENALTVSGAKAMKNKIQDRAKSLANGLQFRMVIRQSKTHQPR